MTITNTDDVIDSRDVIARIEELVADTDRTEEECSELQALKTLAAECEQYSDDWEHGVQLVRDSYFTEFTKQLVDDCYTMPKNVEAWPYRHMKMDWEAAAEELKGDYTSGTFDGVDYWIR